MSSELGVRDSLFLLAHDTDHGFRLRLHPPALDAGLAGATLIDLITAERVHLDDGRVVLANYYDHRPTGDPISDQALKLIRQAPRPIRPVRDLLGALAPRLGDRVLGGLIAAGHLCPVHRRLRHDHYAPTDPAVITRALGGPRGAVQGIGAPTVAADALCGLIQALHLHDTLYLGRAEDLDPALNLAIARLRKGTWPKTSIPTVIGVVDAVIGDLTVAVYR